MKFIKLDAITAKASEKIRQYGSVWRVVQQVDKPDPYFFQSRKPQLYITPVPVSTVNPKENLGDNFIPSGTIANQGAMWISLNNDPDYDYVECHINGTPVRKAA